MRELGGRKIGVVSGRGGVGKSILAVNMCATLTRHGSKNILVDADLSNPSVSLHLGLAYSPVGLQDVLRDKKEFRDAVLVHPSLGMRVLPSSLKFMRGTTLKNLGGVLEKVGGAYEFTIVDSPPGLTEDVLHIVDACDELIVVTTPDVPGVSSATKMISICKENGKRVTGVVVNRCTGAPFELTTQEIESMTETAVIARIPEDKAIPASISARIPAVFYAPHSPASSRLRDLSFSIAGIPFVSARVGGFFSRFLGFFRRFFR